MVEQAIEYRELDPWELRSSRLFARALMNQEEVDSGGVNTTESSLTLAEQRGLASRAIYSFYLDLRDLGRSVLTEALRNDPELREKVFDNPNVLNNRPDLEKLRAKVMPVTTKV